MMPRARIDGHSGLDLANHRAQGLHLPADRLLVVERLVGDIQSEPLLPALGPHVIPKRPQAGLIGPLVLGPQLAAVHAREGIRALVGLLAAAGLRRHAPAEAVEHLWRVGVRHVQHVERVGRRLVERAEVGLDPAVLVPQHGIGMNAVGAQPPLGHEAGELAPRLLGRLPGSPPLRAVLADVEDGFHVPFLGQREVPHVDRKRQLGRL